MPHHGARQRACADGACVDPRRCQDCCYSGRCCCLGWRDGVHRVAPVVILVHIAVILVLVAVVGPRCGDIVVIAIVVTTAAASPTIAIAITARSEGRDTADVPLRRVGGVLACARGPNGDRRHQRRRVA